MSKKIGNSTWINLEDIRSLFSEEEIEARKREIIEEMELKRKKDFEAKELMKQARQEHKDKGWDSSKIGTEIRVNPDVQEVIDKAIKEVIEPEIIEPEEEKPVIIEEPIEEEKEEEEAEIDPKIEEIKKLKEQLDALEKDLKGE